LHTKVFDNLFSLKIKSRKSANLQEMEK